ncbi:hypothetical protein, partial [Burkholderia thailandensis]|uniref:hypothetical protein n=1 Tax=Burkholderia thailandensis TaxID=57975 RepID=UPI001ED95799
RFARFARFVRIREARRNVARRTSHGMLPCRNAMRCAATSLPHGCATYDATAARRHARALGFAYAPGTGRRRPPIDRFGLPPHSLHRTLNQLTEIKSRRSVRCITIVIKKNRRAP